MIVIAMGGNLDWRGLKTPDIFTRALGALKDVGAFPYRASYLYRTHPVGPPQAPYLNVAFAVQYLRAPTQLMRELHQIEAQFDRQRTQIWGPRTLDLDLIDFHGQRWSQDLQLPHPRLSQRAFVLRPLRDLAPAWRHPLSGAGIDQLIAALSVAQKKNIIERSQQRFSLQKEGDAPKNQDNPVKIT